MQDKYAVYVEALKAELIPAMGCTEPIAIAYASAVCREQLEGFPESVDIYVSRNIIKNVKSVVVPNTNKMRGIEVACVAGFVAGHSERQLQVLAYISEEEKAAIKKYTEAGIVKVHVSEEPDIFYIRVEAVQGGHTAAVTIRTDHTNITCIKKDDCVIMEKLLRALLLSDLITIYLKQGIGKLSAYCGAVSAGCGSGAGIAFLHDCTSEQIEHVVENALAINSGIICDGAKSSCAAKIAMSIEGGLLAFDMMMAEKNFAGGDGIVQKTADETIAAVGKIASQGMVETDREIIDVMLGI